MGWMLQAWIKKDLFLNFAIIGQWNFDRAMPEAEASTSTTRHVVVVVTVLYELYIPYRCLMSCHRMKDEITENS